jgi:gluconate 2-dehydrogenase gamma chain
LQNMDRRKYLKAMTVGTVGAGVILNGCDAEKKQEVKTESAAKPAIDRYGDEAEREAKLLAETFFNEHEMKTIKVLADIIIPKDEMSGSASDAGVPDFIEFIVKDFPVHQVPMRGGLKWLDMHCLRSYGKPFVDCAQTQQIEVVDAIAFPDKAIASMKPGVAFFNRMRDLTATGFFTSKAGLQDLGYAGNTPNQWDGVPEEVLAQYGLKYDQRTLDIAVKHT